MRLLLARVGAGKTAAVQERLIDLKRRDPLAKVWVLLSTDRQIVDFRERLTGNGRVFFNVEVFNFYSLYHHLLASAGTPQRCLDDTARFGLIRAMLAGRGGYFGKIAETPGFVQIIARFIYELKQNLIEPEEFASAAGTLKERELAEIYGSYQQTLKDHDLVDREGEGWLALHQIEQMPEIGRAVDLLIVDGYDQFNYLQAELITVLGAQAQDAVITLTTVPGRETTIGSRFQDALDHLTAAHKARRLTLDVQTVTTAPLDQRPSALRQLSARLGLPKSSQPISSDGAIRWIEAPDPAREVGAVLRRVKRLLLDGCAPDDILIALRDWEQYGGQFAAQGQVYGLPMALHYGDALSRSPAVVALLDLIRLHAGDFRRRDLLDALRSPYFVVPGLDAARVDLLDRISGTLRVTGGRRAWLEAVELAAQPAPESPDDDYDTPTLIADAGIGLREALRAFFEAVTPPERATVEQYVAWLDGLIGWDADPDEADQPEPSGYTLAMPEQIRREADDAIVGRDLAAMQQFKHALRGLLAAEMLAGSLGYAGTISRTTFLRDLRTTVDNTSVGRGAGRAGRVLVTTVADARGLPHRHVFIPGLSEGIFPQPAPEDPLLLDSERERLRAAGIRLDTQAERAGDDGLFYSLIGQARESLTLSRPHSKNGEEWASSHLWRATLAVFDDAEVEHLKLGEVPRDPATVQEAALAAADRLSRGELRGWVDASYWARIRRGWSVEMGRLSRAPHDHYSGRLSDPDLIAWVADRLSPDWVWSASQLNDYGMCGFRYFAGRLLNLEPLEEPEDGMDSRQLGTLYHAILEQTYRELGGAITPERLDEALATLNAVAEAQMRSAPDRLRFRASAQWAQEQIVLRRRLERLIRDDFSAKNPLSKAFGAEPRAVYRQESRFETALDLGDQRLRVRGSIDRMDRQGERVILIDYKTGSTRIPKSETERGRNFQLMVYLLAAERLIDLDVAGGLFWQIGGDSLGDLTREDAEVIDAGKDHLRRYLEQARAGDFAAHATALDGGKCSHVCDFHQFCRVSQMHRQKRQPS